MNVIAAGNPESIRPVVLANVCVTAQVQTDEGAQYNWMKKQYEHSVVKHTMGEYARGAYFTNTIEGAFSHFKRSIIGVYHKASDKHIDRYLGMFAWRWTSRKMGEGQRVNALLKSTVARTLTYKVLIGK
jgi:hypothetical protein